MSAEQTLPPQTLPAPSPELVLWRVSVEAFIAMQSRRKGERFLELVAEKLAAEANLAEVFRLRVSAEHEAMRRAHREASVAFQRLMPIFLARLPEE